MTSPKAGYPAYIYRASNIADNNDASNIYHRTNKVLVITDDGLPADQQLPKFISPEPGMPAVKIKSRSDLHLLYAEPEKPGVYEFGGTYIFSNHPDFARLSPYPIPLHDRIKSQTNHKNIGAITGVQRFY